MGRTVTGSIQHKPYFHLIHSARKVVYVLVSLRCCMLCQPLAMYRTSRRAHTSFIHVMMVFQKPIRSPQLLESVNYTASKLPIAKNLGNQQGASILFNIAYPGISSRTVIASSLGGQGHLKHCIRWREFYTAGWLRTLILLNDHG